MKGKKENIKLARFNLLAQLFCNSFSDLMFQIFLRAVGTGAAAPAGMQLLEAELPQLQLRLGFLWCPVQPRGFCGDQCWLTCLNLCLPILYKPKLLFKNFINQKASLLVSLCHLQAWVKDLGWWQLGAEKKKSLVCFFWDRVLDNELVQIAWTVSREELMWFVAEWIKLKFSKMPPQETSSS